MTREEAIKEIKSWDFLNEKETEAIETLIPELAESEDEKIRKWMIGEIKAIYDFESPHLNPMVNKALAYLEKQKENPKSADSILSDCTLDAKSENKWHKVGDSLPDNGRLVLANDCLGNTLLARYDGEGNWEVSVYDNEDYYCRNTITKWCEIPSEKQKEKKVDIDKLRKDIYQSGYNDGYQHGKEDAQKEQKPAEWSEEDEEIRRKLMSLLANVRGDRITETAYQKYYPWLKSLRPSWKPSEEQMETFKDIFGDFEGYPIMKSLYEELEKRYNQ